MGTFLISFTFGILSALSYDATSVMNFIFSNDNLLTNRYLIDDKNTADVINICLNYGGDFATELLNIKNTDMIFMDNIYKYSYEIMEKDFNLDKTSTGIKTVLDFYKNILDDIRLVEAKKNDKTITPSVLLSELRRWSDFYIEKSYQVKCANILKDAWAINNKQCPDGYKYKSTFPPGGDINSCFLIPEFKEEDLKVRYATAPSQCGNSNDIYSPNDVDFDNFQTPIMLYWDILRRYNDWHTDLVKKIIVDLEM